MKKGRNTMINLDSPCSECEFCKFGDDSEYDSDDCLQGIPTFGSEYGCYRFSPTDEYTTDGDWKYVRVKKDKKGRNR